MRAAAQKADGIATARIDDHGLRPTDPVQYNRDWIGGAPESPSLSKRGQPGKQDQLEGGRAGV